MNNSYIFIQTPNKQQSILFDKSMIFSDESRSILDDGTQEWYKDGVLHRDGDKPAYIGANGTQFWYRNGVIHRDGDLPAYIGSDGTQTWYQNGVIHRDGDNPAHIGGNGTHIWYQNGVIHRDGDKYAVMWSSKKLQELGKQYEWYHHGKFIKSSESVC